MAPSERTVTDQGHSDNAPEQHQPSREIPPDQQV
jgi:hypothetical protein